MIALASVAAAVVVYVILAGCAPRLAGDIGWCYALVVCAAWGVLARRMG